MRFSGLLFMLLLTPAHASSMAEFVTIERGLVGLLVLCLLLVVAYLVIIKQAAKKQHYESLKFSNQPVFVTKENGSIIFVNEVAVDLTEQPLDYFASVSIFELIDGLPECLLNNISCQEIRNRAVCVCNKLSPDNKEFALIRKNGHSIPVKISVLREDGGNFIYYLQELSTQKKLVEQLESQNKVATIGEFLAGVLHEVGNPMAAIEGIAANLVWLAENQEQDFSFEYLKEQLTIIQTQANRVNQVKNEFSLISHESSRSHEQRQLIDVHVLLRQLVDLAKFDKRSVNIQINLSAEAQLPAINSHSGKLTQILLNLFSNAFDALQEQSNAHIDIIAAKEHKFVKITICDNGPGISEHLLEKIFEPFYTTKIQGTGLGLMICKRLALSLGIDFKITSQVTQYTQVELMLPLDDGKV